jgi:predicted dehydrogenase
MAERRVRVGFIGLGHNGLAHLRTHLSCGASDVVALCDRNGDLLAKAGAETGVRRLYQDARELVNDPAVEAVSISTGDNDHREPFVLALAAGKHVLVEKPLANSEEDVLAMVEAARRAGPRLKIAVGYILRFNPVFAEIHRLCRTGALGEIYYLEGDYIHNLVYQKNQWDKVTGRNWYLDEERPMVGGGSHPLDLLRWFSGKQVVQVWGGSNRVAFPEMHHDDCQVCLYRFDDGTLAKVAALYGPRCGMAPFYNVRVYGTRGTVERDTVALSRTEEEVHPAFVPVDAERVSGHPYLPEVLDWLEAIRNDGVPRTPLWDGAGSTLATLCACRAMREGVPVDVPVIRPWA